MKLTAVYEDTGEWIIAYIAEIPGVNTQGKTIEDARENLKDALQMVLEANRKLSMQNQNITYKEEFALPA